MEPVLLIANIFDGSPNLFLKFIDQSVWTAHFACQDDPICRHQGFAGHASVGIRLEKCVDDRV